MQRVWTRPGKNQEKHTAASARSKDLQDTVKVGLTKCLAAYERRKLEGGSWGPKGQGGVKALAPSPLQNQERSALGQ